MVIMNGLVYKEIESLPLLLKPEEVADILGISRDSMLLCIQDSVFPTIKIGRDYLIPKKSIVDFLDKVNDTKSSILEGIVKSKEIFAFVNEKCVFGSEHDMEISIKYNGRAICANCAAELIIALKPLGNAVLRQPVKESIRLEAYKRKNCGYCGRILRGTNRVLDHIIPVSKGGTNVSSNLIACCRQCNTEKRDKTLFEWKIVLEEELNKIKSLSTKTAQKRRVWIESVLSNINRIEEGQEYGLG